MTTEIDRHRESLERNTRALEDLKSEVRRLCEVFGKILDAEPVKRKDALDTLVSSASTAIVDAFRGGGRKKR